MMGCARESLRKCSDTLEPTLLLSPSVLLFLLSDCVTVFFFHFWILISNIKFLPLVPEDALQKKKKELFFFLAAVKEKN